MKTRKFVTVLLISIVLGSCVSKTTVTSMQNSTPTPNPTDRPVPLPQISSGAVYYEWNMGDDTSPYVVWGAQLRDSINGSCQGFICEGRDLRKYDDTIWKFLGKGDYGLMYFSFDINKNGQIDPNELFDTFNIRFRSDIGFDSITRVIQAGEHLPTVLEEEVAAPYGESSNLSLVTLIDAKNKNIPQPICGIIDPSIQGDQSFSLASDSGALIFSFLDMGSSNRPLTTPKGHSLISLTVSAAPKHLISPEDVCP